MRLASMAAIAGAVALLVGCRAGSSGDGLASRPATTTPKTVRVPNVVGKTESRAQCALATAGLRWRYRGGRRVSSCPIIPCSTGTAVTPDPKVISQSTLPGTPVRVGGVVVLDDECLLRVRAHQGCA